ncbi:hypothetical protein MGYG_03596 [Nannizzia gypsea CBS 118893]|uniref:LysM domain-containing protein n=1 Tax=Arthroderma gypseum (strain ATCC MYA-4604 / CBS 118893) TaxID=535722 RepID=E4USS6_ARTGP|nr:hypothetical protein MGYG_03596 [Nannizzia gypsea CBS 118893]EFR00591.1 hypothetical protein MGYG_03596 [Nannizzia gypsea CBS 118893]
MVKYALLPLVAVALVQAGSPEWHHSRTPTFSVDPKVHKGCTSWINVVDAAGKLTCDAFLDTINVAKRQFIFWNPQLNGDCSNIQSKASYCAFLPSHATKQARQRPPPGPNGPKPLPPGLFQDGFELGNRNRKRSEPYPAKKWDGPHGPKEGPPPGWKLGGNGGHGKKLVAKSPMATGMPSHTMMMKHIGTGMPEPRSEPPFMPPHIPNLPNEMTNNRAAYPTTMTTELRPPAATNTKRDANVPASTPSPVSIPILGCKQFHTVKAGDTCSTVVKQYPGLRLSELLKLNPNLGPACPALPANTRICVRRDPRTGSLNTPSAAVDIHSRDVQDWPSPTKPGTNPGCKSFELIKKGDTCVGVCRKHHIVPEMLIRWNPAVGRDCEMLEVGYYVCVRI